MAYTTSIKRNKRQLDNDDDELRPSIPTVDYWPRFLVIETLDKSPFKLNPFAVSKGIHGIAGKTITTAQFLSRLLAPFGKDGKSYISDSSSFVNQLKESNLTGTTVSYDVVDLFTNIPLEEAPDILRSKLANRIDNLDTHLTIDSIINLARSCFDTSYFTFNEIFMTSFEEAALSTALFQPLYWYRKVDDTFTTIANDNDPIDCFQGQILVLSNSSDCKKVVEF
ncbi:uncharacterized protein [Haliotis asinina]|uniref:uncharacterized protein n=1 Tax=Haliotis asinina TaxID=109174 RepID=UPI0035326BD3